MKLYAGNLPLHIDSPALGALFESHGRVSAATVIFDKENGISRAFGFIEMEDADGRGAIDALNHTEIDGRVIIVNEAIPPRYRRQQPWIG